MSKEPIPIADQVWDQSVLRGHKGPISVLASHPSDPFVLASGSDDFTARLWDYRTQKSVKCFLGPSLPVSSICFDTKLPHVLHVSYNGQVLGFDIRKEGVLDREAASAISLGDITVEVNSISMHQKERILVIADDEKVSVIDLLQTKTRLYSHFHSNIISKASFRPGSAGEIASCAFDYRYCCWDYRTGKAKFSVDFSSLRWNDDSASCDGIPLTNPPFPHDFVFLDRGRQSAVAMGDGSVCVISNADGGVLGRVQGHGGMVTNLDGNLVSEFVSAGVDKCVKVWTVGDTESVGKGSITKLMSMATASEEMKVSMDVLAICTMPHKINALSCAKNEAVLSKTILVGDTQGNVSVLQLKI